MRNWEIALAVMLAGVGGGVIGASRGGGVVGASLPSELPGLSVPSSSTTTTAEPPRHDAGELHFLDARVGWAPVSTSCQGQPCIVVYATDNGGSTWTARTDPPVPVDANQDRRVLAQPLLRLHSEEVGWLVDIDGILYSTTDAAKTWRQNLIGRPVVGLEAAGRTVWRLEQDCPTSQERCRYTLVTSEDAGLHWKRADPQPPIGNAGASSLTPALVRASASTAYIFSDAGSYPAANHSGDPPPNDWSPDPVLSKTEDGGRSWITMKPPCPAPGEGGYWGADLAVSSPQDVWLVCDDAAGSGANQPKHLRRSLDGGQHWSKDLGTPNAGNGGRTAAASTLRACRGGSRTSISCTRDGGHTWFFPIPGAADNPRDGGVEVYQFADETHGWAIAQDLNSGDHNVVWRTTDGGETWSPSHVES
jgi:photosystem II stability/assembly factor-like uncharacterized protein